MSDPLEFQRLSSLVVFIAGECADSEADGETLKKFLRHLDEAAHAALAVSRTDQQRRKVYAALAGGLHTAARCSGGTGEATKELYDALEGLASGVIGDDRLKKIPVTGSKPVQEDNLRAEIIVAIEQAPDKRDQIIERGAAALGLKPHQVCRILDNHKQGGIKSEALRLRVEDIRRRVADGEKFWIEDLIS